VNVCNVVLHYFTSVADLDTAYLFIINLPPGSGAINFEQRIRIRFRILTFDQLFEEIKIKSSIFYHFNDLLPI
jgi:hypothetical protein